MGGKRKLEQISAYITPELKTKLEQWAEDEARSLSSLVVYLLQKAVKEKDQQQSDRTT